MIIIWAWYINLSDYLFTYTSFSCLLFLQYYVIMQPFHILLKFLLSPFTSHHYRKNLSWLIELPMFVCALKFECGIVGELCISWHSLLHLFFFLQLESQKMRDIMCGSTLTSNFLGYPFSQRLYVVQNRSYVSSNLCKQ